MFRRRLDAFLQVRRHQAAAFVVKQLVVKADVLRRFVAQADDEPAAAAQNQKQGNAAK